MVLGVPQLSLAVTLPQFLPKREQKLALDSGGQPQTLSVPSPPHVCGEAQVPQSTVLGVPQLSLAVTLPQFLPKRVQKSVLDSGGQVLTHWPLALQA